MPAWVNCRSPEEGNGLMRSLLCRGWDAATVAFGVRVVTQGEPSECGSGRSIGARGSSRLRMLGALCAWGSALALLGAPSYALAAQAPTVEEQWTTHVTATAATFEAKVNPGEALTSYRFEYATSEAALLAGEGELFPAPPASEGEAGAGGEGVVVEERPQDLRPATSYWYRVVASNAEGRTLGCRKGEACRSFTTRPAGGELELPDGRAWELVSPVPTGNGASGAIEPIIGSGSGALIQAGADGDAFTYGMLGSAEPEPPGATNYSQVLSVREPGGGWSAQDISTPHEQASGVSNGKGQEYRFFSSELSVAFVAPIAQPGPLAEDGTALLSPAASERTVYLRADRPFSPGGQGVYGETVPQGAYLPVLTGCPPPLVEKCSPLVEEYADLRPGADIRSALPQMVGATANLSHIVLSSQEPWTETTPEGKPTEGEGLYEWSGGKLQLISVLPDHEQASGGNAALGFENEDARGAVSSDGSRIVWSNSAEGKEHLYMRDVSISPEQTVQLDENKGGGGGEPSPEFQFASSDGSRVFFTDGEALTPGSTAKKGEPNLYQCEMVEVGGELECKLSDLTLDPGGRADVRGVVAVGSEEDTNIYFVAKGELTKGANERGEKAKAGADNLYLLHYDEETNAWKEPVFIVTLSEEDYQDWGEHGSGSLEDVTARVSPNGGYLEFMSDRELTGYDNRDANSDIPDEEVFLYRAPSANAPDGRLVCASCNPTGERPTGVQDSKEANDGEGLLIEEQGIWTGHWLAANVPGWIPALGLFKARYQSRYLSDEGRLFFNSPDALVAQATNGLADVYEYEPVGVGGCRASSAAFSERSGGCVGLISSGSSGEESAFLDASESGEDVFFLSSSRLVSADTGSGLAVYDAHVCSAAAPCPSEVASPPPCTTEASCKPLETPQPTIFGPGPSETFSGPGNPAPPPALVKSVAKQKSVKCKKGLVKKHGKCVRAKRSKRASKSSRERRTGR